MGLIVKGTTDFIEIGAATPSGQSPGILRTIKTYKDSIFFTKEDDTISEENSDQDEEPIAIFQTPGKIKITFSTFDYDPETLLLLFGGQVLNGSWYPPVETNLEPNLLFFVCEISESFKIELGKCVCKAKFNYNMKRDGIALIEAELMLIANKFLKIFEI